MFFFPLKKRVSTYRQIVGVREMNTAALSTKRNMDGMHTHHAMCCRVESFRKLEGYQDICFDKRDVHTSDWVKHTSVNLVVPNLHPKVTRFATSWSGPPLQSMSLGIRRSKGTHLNNQDVFKLKPGFVGDVVGDNGARQLALHV